MLSVWGSHDESMPSAHSFTLGGRRIRRTFNCNRLYCREQKSERVPKNPQEVVLSEHCSGSGDLVMGRSLLADSFTLATRKTVHIFNHRASEQKVLFGRQILLTYSGNGHMNHVMIPLHLESRSWMPSYCSANYALHNCLQVLCTVSPLTVWYYELFTLRLCVWFYIWHDILCNFINCFSFCNLILVAILHM